MAQAAILEARDRAQRSDRDDRALGAGCQQRADGVGGGRELRSRARPDRPRRAEHRESLGQVDLDQPGSGAECGGQGGAVAVDRHRPARRSSPLDDLGQAACGRGRRKAARHGDQAHVFRVEDRLDLAEKAFPFARRDRGARFVELRRAAVAAVEHGGARPGLRVAPCGPHVDPLGPERLGHPAAGVSAQQSHGGDGRAEGRGSASDVEAFAARDDGRGQGAVDLAGLEASHLEEAVDRGVRRDGHEPARAPIRQFDHPDSIPRICLFSRIATIAGGTSANIPAATMSG